MDVPRLLVVGYLSIDTVEQVDGRAHRQAGGAGLYAALGARWVGVAVDLCASLGDDFPAKWLGALDHAGIGLDRLRRRSERSRWAHLVYAADGSRRSPHFDDPEWHRSSEIHAPRPPADLSPYGMIVAGPMHPEALADLLDAAGKAGVPVVVDVNEHFAAVGGRRLLDLLPSMSAFAPSREETRTLLPDLTDDEAARHLARLGPAVVQKRGADGLFCLDAGGAGEWRLPARPARVVDPTGAGDSTVGAYAAGRLLGQDCPTAARFALMVGALAVSDAGPSGLLPALQPLRSASSDEGVSPR